MRLLLTIMLAFSGTQTLAQADAEQLLRAPRSPISAHQGLARRSFSGCWLTPVRVSGQDPITGAARNIRLKDYGPVAKKGQHPTVILLPPTGGENVLDNAYANHLCRRGFRVVLVTGWDHQDDAGLDPRMHDRGAIRAALAVQHTLDFVAPAPGKKVGILGTSVGAITAALAMGVDERIGAGFFIVGGAEMVEVIGRSTEKTLTQLREARMAHFNLRTVDEYTAFLKAYIHIDPLLLAPRLRERPTAFVIAKQDQTVPTRNQLLLAHAAWSKEIVFEDGDHLKVILRSSLKHRETIRRFFERNLRLVMPVK
jgi:dienelactone hydrolase